MQLRAIPDTLLPEVVAEIDTRLADVERQHAITIPWAIESGSRAWGFPSPDSDYDCRFIFVRPLNDYLSLWQKRDVIETPLERELDVNGWDLGKALKLMLKGNAVVIEWLRSPIIYRGDAQFRDELLALARRFTSRSLVARHYLHLGARQSRIYLADEAQVPLKKIFYALRPAAALRWLRLHPGEAVVPMHFPTLMLECEPPPTLTEIISDLLLRKAETRELGAAPLPEPIAAFMAKEFEEAQEAFRETLAPLSEAAGPEADAFFRETIRRFT